MKSTLFHMPFLFLLKALRYACSTGELKCNTTQRPILGCLDSPLSAPILTFLTPFDVGGIKSCEERQTPYCCTFWPDLPVNKTQLLAKCVVLAT
ncbi:hypothetical protein O181_024174 [Austropuccinia psidii MF-1]|uniref:Secreted protein n=1 Tax=Austropuccinia psidii MF-1 TaxID=1389203 RepID=A0A9Q3CI51_9BASI|nr:hypothetical protein [Austropuccinia psidii MF-1]